MIAIVSRVLRLIVRVSPVAAPLLRHDWTLSKEMVLIERSRMFHASEFRVCSSKSSTQARR